MNPVNKDILEIAEKAIEQDKHEGSYTNIQFLLGKSNRQIKQLYDLIQHRLKRN